MLYQKRLITNLYQTNKILSDKDSDKIKYYRNDNN